MRLWSWVLASVLTLTALQAQARDPVRAYMFANSLVHHLSDTPQTAVPYWLAELARGDDRTFRMDGQWGFLRNFADAGRIEPNWSFPNVRGVTVRGGLKGAQINTVLINAANFIQYQAPDAPYDGDNPDGASPLSASVRLLDWLKPDMPDARIVIYEGWAEMAGVTGRFPPSNRALRRYHRFNLEEHHDWHLDWLAQLQAAQPDLDIRLIRVASTLSAVLSEEPWSDIPVTDLYSDDAPHGTATLYLLAALITYAGIYDNAPPVIDLPDTIHPIVRDNLAAAIAAIMQAVPADEARARVAPVVAVQQASAAPIEDDSAPVAVAVPVADTPAPQTDPEPVETTAVQFRTFVPVTAQVVSGPPGQGLDNPSLAMGLNGIADWSTQHPFLDLMKTARPWTGHKPGQWGGFEAGDLQAGGHLNAQGWPVSLPKDADRLEAFILTDQPLAATHLRGAYVLRYEGTGDLRVAGRASRVWDNPNEIRFNYEPGDGLVAITLFSTDPDDPVRNISVVREDQMDLHDAGLLFNPLWLARVQDLRSIRFMDWMFTNGSPLSSWDGRPQVSDYTWVWRGVPAEVMITLANEIGAGPWFTMPHMADDGYVAGFAGLVATGLDPRLTAYIEYSNEVWNAIFPQAGYAREQAVARWGSDAGDDAWMQFYGVRAAEVMAIWEEAFGDPDRLVRVVTTHTGWPGLEEAILDAPLHDGTKPRESFDAYAVTGYFGYDVGEGEGLARVQAMVADSVAQAEAAGRAQGLRRVSLREYVKTRQYNAANAPVAEVLREGSLNELMTEVWPYHARTAQARGYDLIMYEGGSHVAGHGASTQNDAMTGFFTAFNYTPEMAGLYETLLHGWSEAGGGLFNAFVDVAPASQFGSWGALRHLDDSNLRWDALMAFNAEGSGMANPAYRHGVIRRAGDVGETLTGTVEEDVLIGGPGNDVLIGHGRADHLHGGDGQDRAVLPGARSEYRFEAGSGYVMALGALGAVRLVSVEEIGFAAAPGVWVAMGDVAG